MSPLRIALVNMPWARTITPSVQCGILKAELVAAGHHVDVHYFNLDLAHELGFDRYRGITGLESQRGSLVAEWLFSAAAFGPRDPSPYFDAFPELAQDVGAYGEDRASLTALHGDLLPAWIDRCAATVLAGGYDLIGFSSTFEQNVASLALAAAVKRADPTRRVVFGGANFDGDMGREYIRVFDWVDYAVLGEGDVTLPALAAAVARGESPRGIPGVAVREGGVLYPAPPPATVGTLSRVPAPDYDDYFATLDRLGRDRTVGRYRVRLPVEFSRGCWWGQKHHCTFCGLNADGMAYRGKPADQAFGDIVSLIERYRVCQLDAVDNIIDMAYLTGLCGALIDSGLDVELFFEVKANLSREQLSVLRRAGISHIQPGLESLSTHILGLMRKGSTMPLNVRLLKWAHYHGIKVSWNMLTGFPGETDADYREQVRLIPTLHHLPPPVGCGGLWLERYSPYFVDGGFPITEIRPKLGYSFAYPVPDLDLGQIAYFFDYKADGVASAGARQALADAVDEWRRRWRTRRPTLTYERGPGFVKVRDTRGTGPVELVLPGWRAVALEACGEQPRTVARLGQQVRAAGYRVADDEIAEFLVECAERRLAVTENGHYLTVALPRRGPLAPLPGSPPRPPDPPGDQHRP